MRVRRSLLTVAVGAGLLVVGTPGVQAGHDAQQDPPAGDHAPMPRNVPPIVGVKAACTLVGEAHLDDVNGAGGVSATEHRHNHYEFESIRARCTDTDPGDGQDFGTFARYDVWADGGTDGCSPPDGSSLVSCLNFNQFGPVPGHGESWRLGWSHGSGYADGSLTSVGWAAAPGCHVAKSGNQRGDLHLEGGDGRVADGWVKFVRVGPQVEAWGCLEWKDDPTLDLDFFVASLTAVPRDGLTVNDVLLVGTSVIGR